MWNYINPISVQGISHRRACRTQRLFKAFFLSVLSELSGEPLCFFSDQTGRSRPAALLIWNYISKVGVGSILGHIAFCRLGWAHSRLCWVSLHSTQPTFFRCYCEMRNPTTADFGTSPQKFLFRLNWPFFRPAAPLVWNLTRTEQRTDWTSNVQRSMFFF